MTDGDGNSVSGKYGEVTMPEYDVTITPVHFSPVTSGSGDIDWTNGAPATSQYNMSLFKTDSPVAIHNGKVGTSYLATGKTGNVCRLMTTYTATGNMTITYTFANLGTEEIKFTPYQINAGDWVFTGGEYVDTYKTKGVSGGEIVLAPNEVKSVEITFSFKNGNIICLFELANDWNNAKLFVSSSIVQS